MLKMLIMRPDKYYETAVTGGPGALPALPSCESNLQTLTSQRCPTMGASAQECSAFRPIFPFLKTINVNDLSNHLRETKMFMSRKCFKRQKENFVVDGLVDFAPTPRTALRSNNKSTHRTPSPSFLPCSRHKGKLSCTGD